MIKKELSFKACIFLFFINFVFFICLFLINFYLDNTTTYNVIFTSVYLVFLVFQDELIIIGSQLSYMLVSYTILDGLWVKTMLQVPLELKYMTDIISFLLIIKIIINYRQYNIRKDSFIVLTIITIIIGSIIALLNNIGIIQLLNTLRIYYRFFPIYIIVSNKNYEFKKYFIFVVVANLGYFVLQILYHFSVDQRTGTFGKGGNIAFSLLLAIILAIALILFQQKKMNLIQLVFLELILIGILGFSENKLTLILTILYTILFSLVISKINIIRKIAIIITCLVILYIGAQITIKVSPSFWNFFKQGNIVEKLDEYIFGNTNSSYQLGRYEALDFINKVDMDNLNTRLFGMGIGASVPDENWFYINEPLGRHVDEFESTKIYKKYGPFFGYHLSSFNFYYIDQGIVGIVLYFSGIFVLVKRSFTCMRRNNSKYSFVIGNIGLTILIWWIPLFIYSGSSIDRPSEYIFYLIAGLITANNKLKQDTVKGEKI